MIVNADSRMIPLADESVQCVVTSPPYWNLRDYGCAAAIGLESSMQEYIAQLVAVFREVWRVLRSDGTVFCNIGDAYVNAGGAGMRGRNGQRAGRTHTAEGLAERGVAAALKPKDLCGIPWRVAFALQADGWYLRQDIIWAKGSPLPESVRDRCTKSHEYVFLLTKRPRYYWDGYAIMEKSSGPSGGAVYGKADGNARRISAEENARVRGAELRNARSVWRINSEPSNIKHFAMFPSKLAERCLRAGTSAKGACPECGAPWRRVIKATGGTIGASWHDHANDMTEGAGQNGPGRARAWREGYTRQEVGWRPGCACGHKNTRPCVVLDPFGGAGTTNLAALRLSLKCVCLEINEDYCRKAAHRLRRHYPLLAAIG